MMIEGSLITEDLKNMLGVEGEPEYFDIEKGHIRRFAQTIGDPNPLWKDESYACKLGYDNIISPPTFLLIQAQNKHIDKLMEMNESLSIINGGMELECYKPSMPGDVITMRAKLIDLYEKQGKTGKLLFMVIEITYINQRAELAGKGRYTFIRS